MCGVIDIENGSLAGKVALRASCKSASSSGPDLVLAEPDFWPSVPATLGLASLARLLAPMSSTLPCTRSRKGVDPFCKCQGECFEECSRAIIDEPVGFIEQIMCIANVGLGVLHGRYVERHQRLAQMVVGAKAAESAD